MMRRRTFLHVACGIALVLACLSVFDAGGFRRHLKLEREIASLEQRNLRVGEENRQLVQEIELLRKDRRALERAAREELGFVKPGEVVITLE